MLKMILAMLLSASSMLLYGAEDGKIRNLTPRAEDANSMRACGVELEAVKTQNGFIRRVVLKGGEIATGMQFCKNGKMAVSSTRYRITVPQGEEIVAWVNAAGTRGVIEGCINITNFETPIPPEEPEKPAELEPHQPAPLSIPPNYRLQPWSPAEPEPATPVQTTTAPCGVVCVSIMSTYALAELKPNDKPIEVWAEIQGGKLAGGIWRFNGVEVGQGPRITLDPKKMYKISHGKAGIYFLSFIGKTEDGQIVACGLRGTPIELVKRGRSWVWKLPVLHCLYAYSKGIKDWSTWGALEKTLFCPAEAAAVWYFWPGEEAAKTFPQGPWSWRN